jgi:hypothetical protein
MDKSPINMFNTAPMQLDISTDITKEIDKLIEEKGQVYISEDDPYKINNTEKDKQTVEKRNNELPNVTTGVDIKESKTTNEEIIKEQKQKENEDKTINKEIEQAEEIILSPDDEDDIVDFEGIPMFIDVEDRENLISIFSKIFRDKRAFILVTALVVGASISTFASAIFFYLTASDDKKKEIVSTYVLSAENK